MKWKEAFTQQKNTSMLIWFWMILLVLREGFGIDQPYKVVNDTTTCQEIIKVTGYQTRLPCTGKDVRYHCLLDGNKTVEYEVCREWKWIPKGKCAYFNTYGSGNVDETDCESTPGLSCAVKEYNSADNTQYAACYVKKEMTTVPILETSSRVVDSSTGENSSLGQTPPTNSIQDEQSHPGSDIGITFGVLLPIIFMAAAVLLFKFGNLLEHCRTGSRENIDIEGHPCVNEKLLKNNEEGEKKDENERNEDKTSTKTSKIVNSHSDSSIPNSALTQMSENRGNECSDTESTPVNGSSEIPVQADDTVQGKKEVAIDIGESELSSPTQGTVEKAENESTEKNENQSNEADDKEETTLEEEDPGGVFDDTLETIKRKDVEEKGGSQDLHDFLEEVSERLTTKILYRVLKSHVTEPQNYLTDELKISKVKELLPAEYHSYVNNDDSIKKKPLPVMYAILQLSLEEEHQPKSGWGQEVKDTDTGVGDDVERLYRVHELYREIANPEQISLDGYTRLFKVLFKAVDRLDVKRWCKEDYQEFVQKWENLQRNQWVKDNLKALQSFFKNWSLRSSATD